MNVMIIDDDVEDTEMFLLALNEVAPHIVCQPIHNPKNALIQIKENELSPDIIFLDANMFLIDGKECLRELRKLPNLQHTKIYMYSGFINEKHVVELKSLGANDYINKPHSFEGLKNLLQSIFIESR